MNEIDGIENFSLDFSDILCIRYNMKRIVKRYHDFSYGHRIHGHESVCGHLHGHNGRVTFYCTASKLDSVGRVVDFSVIRLCL